MTTEHQRLLALLDEAFDGKAWHGPTLKGALRGVTGSGGKGDRKRSCYRGHAARHRTMQAATTRNITTARHRRAAKSCFHAELRAAHSSRWRTWAGTT